MRYVEIRQPDGTEYALRIVDDASITDTYAEQARASVRVLRDEWQSIGDTIDEINDEFYIYDDSSKLFGGRIVDVTNEDDNVLLEIGSFEEDALDAEPTGQTEEFVGVSDSDVVLDAISRVPELSAGTIDTTDNDVSILFSNTTPAGMIREIQRSTKAFVRYNADKTVDYLESVSGSVVGTVGPDESNVQDQFEVIENERDKFTHVRVLGAQEGKARLTAEAVSSGYSGGRKKWKTYPDKSITKQSRAQKIANEIMSEVENNPKRVRVNTVVFGLDIQVGDRLSVVSQIDNIDQELWVVKEKSLLQGATDVSEVELSNRRIIEESDGQKRRRDVERFNSGFQGDVVTINSGGYRAPVTSSNAYTFSIRKPGDVVGELTAEIEIDALPYRAYSSGAASSGGLHSHSVTFPDHNHGFSVNIPDHDHEVTIDIPDHDHDVTYGVPQHSHIIPFTLGAETELADGHRHGYDKPANSTSIDVDETETNTTTSDNGGGFFSTPTTDDGGGFFTSDTTDDGGGTTETSSSTTPEHTHDPDPGVIEFGSETPSDVGVIVNGTEVASNVGTGNFTEVVDIGGTLTEGFNTVQVTSSSLGHIRATAFLDVYRQITQ